MNVSFRSLYRASVKSRCSDELVNTYLQRPAAALVTYGCAFTPVTPNQLTLVSTLFGVASAVMLAVDPPMLVAAGACAYLKDLFDSADGQLARATARYSRRGRFWDSIGDFAVNMLLSAGFFFALRHEAMGAAAAFVLSLSAWLCLTLRVSYQVFYQTSYLHLRGTYELNRVSEEVRPEDRAEADRLTLLLQKIFLALYGWQDSLIAGLDARSRRRAGNPDDESWYADRTGLRFNSLFGMGTDFVALALCLAAGSVDAYLIASLGVFNLLWASAIVYRFFFALRSSSSSLK
jgi:phosphatidylglycerophosphate synthase